MPRAERMTIEQFQADDHGCADEHRQPELLIESAAGDVEQPRKRARLRAPLDRGELLDHQRQRLEAMLPGLQII